MLSSPVLVTELACALAGEVMAVTQASPAPRPLPAWLQPPSSSAENDPSSPWECVDSLSAAAVVCGTAGRAGLVRLRGGPAREGGREPFPVRVDEVTVPLVLWSAHRPVVPLVEVALLAVVAPSVRVQPGGGSFHLLTYSPIHSLQLRRHFQLPVRGDDPHRATRALDAVAAELPDNATTRMALRAAHALTHSLNQSLGLGDVGDGGKRGSRAPTAQSQHQGVAPSIHMWRTLYACRRAAHPPAGACSRPHLLPPLFPTLWRCSPRLLVVGPVLDVLMRGTLECTNLNDITTVESGAQRRYTHIPLLSHTARLTPNPPLSLCSPSVFPARKLHLRCGRVRGGAGPCRAVALGVAPPRAAGCVGGRAPSA